MEKIKQDGGDSSSNQSNKDCNTLDNYWASGDSAIKGSEEENEQTYSHTYDEKILKGDNSYFDSSYSQSNKQNDERSFEIRNRVVNKILYAEKMKQDEDSICSIYNDDYTELKHRVNGCSVVYDIEEDSCKQTTRTKYMSQTKKLEELERALEIQRSTFNRLKRNYWIHTQTLVERIKLLEAEKSDQKHGCCCN